MKSMKYPEYRVLESYLEIEIPSHWDELKIKYLFTLTSDKGHSNLELLSVYRDFGVIPKSSQDDNFNKPSLDLSNYKRISPGDLVTNKMKTWQGSIAISQFKGIVSPAYYTFSPTHNHIDKYLHYLLRSQLYVSKYSSISKGIRVNQWDLEINPFRDLKLILPPRLEQKVISQYLDEQLENISSIINNKLDLIINLKEYRSALITHAVTKGLDPDVKMKDSGIDWIGKIPEHWEVKKLKYVCKFNPSKCEINKIPQDTIVSFVPMEKIQKLGSINSSENRLLADVINGYTYFRNGDVLIAKITPCFENAKFTVARGLSNNIGLGTTELHVLRTAKSVQNQYLFFFLLNHHFRQSGQSEMYGAAGQKRVPKKFIENYQGLIPPIREQGAIVEYLKNKCELIDNIKSKTETSIKYLRDYKQSLITHAVTGKIKIENEEVSKRTNANPYFMRTVLAAEIIQYCQSLNQTIGKIMLMKILFLCQYHLNMPLDGKFLRKEYGPMDNKMMRSILAQLKNSNWFRYLEHNKYSKFEQLHKSNDFNKYYPRYWKEYDGKLKKLLRKLGKFDTERYEIVVTLYSAWQDLLLKNSAIKDNAILEEVLLHWHKSKENIPRDRWQTALNWMKKKELTPLHKEFRVMKKASAKETI